MIDVFIFLFGLSIGSFLNVVIYRLPENKSIVKPNSFCPKCSSPIKFYNNIPLLSYIILKGHCSDCGEKISIKYPVVELSTGLLFLLSFFIFGLSLKLIGVLILVALLIAITVTDFEKQIIPDKLIIFGLEAGFALWLATILSRLTNSMNISAIPLIEIKPLLNSVAWWSWIGLFSGVALVLLIAVISGVIMKAETMGGGDIKLAALIGFYLGPYVMLVIALSFVIGALVTLPLLLTGKIKRKQHVPFGPFISLACLIVLFWGQQIWVWYWQFLSV